MGPVERLYTSDQVSRALERAADLEQGSGASEVARTLYDVAELEAIAREAGISLEALHRALRELDRPKPGLADRLLGAPTRYHAELEAPRQLSQEEVERVVRSVRKSLGQVGELTSLGNTITWVARQGSVPIELAIENDPDRAFISVDVRFEHMIGGLFGGIGGGLGGGASSLWVFAARAVVGSTPIAVGLGLGLSFTFAFGLARYLYARNARRQMKKVDALLDELRLMTRG